MDKYYRKAGKTLSDESLRNNPSLEIVDSMLESNELFNSILREGLYGNVSDPDKRSTLYRFHPDRDIVVKNLYGSDRYSYTYEWHKNAKDRPLYISHSFNVPIEESDEWGDIFELLQRINQEKHHGLYSEEELEDITDALIENGRIEDRASRWLRSHPDDPVNSLVK